MHAAPVLPLILGAVALTADSSAAQRQTRTTLDIYVIDVEGGNATLIVSPSGDSLLIDTGNPSNGRDAERILAAAKDARLTQIDHLITTHYHADHIGGLPELVPRVPIRHFIDHGPNIQAMPIAPTPGPGATPPPAHNGPAYWIKLSARQDGSYTVTNTRNGFTKTYAPAH